MGDRLTGNVKVDMADKTYRRKLTATIHIHHRRLYYYSAHKLILILPSNRGWKAESTKILVESLMFLHIVCNVRTINVFLCCGNLQGKVILRLFRS